jgi:membrane dipeptidase
MNNELGDCMTESSKHYGLTQTGKKVVERMQEMGMIVDVAHASSATLRDIVEISSAPIIDSHTNPHPRTSGRLRGMQDISKIVKTGGIVCTWPLRYNGRETFEDWAKEILHLKNQFGINHIGLGTDGCGGLPMRIKGYRDIRDLTKLADIMNKLGLSRGDISAFMGSNFSRVFKECVG